MTGLRNSFLVGISKITSMKIKKILLLFLFVFLPFCCSKMVIKRSSAPETSQWPQLGRDPQRSNMTPEIVKPPLDLAWEYKALTAIGPTIVATEGALVITSLDGQIVALDATSGAKRGIRKTRPRYEQTCALHFHHLVLAKRLGEPSIMLVDLNTSKTVWKKNPSPISTEPLIVGDRIYIAADNRTLYAYDFYSGEQSWSYHAEDNLHSSPAFSHDLIFFGCDDGSLRAVSTVTGELLWEYHTDSAILAPPSVGNEFVFFGSSGYNFYALSLESGILHWVFPTQGQILHAPAVTENVVVFGCNDYYVYCVNIDDGKEVWRFEAKSVISTSPIISGQVVYFGSLDQHYYAVDLQTGEELWKYKTKGRIRTSPIISGGWLYGASEDRYVYAFKPRE